MEKLASVDFCWFSDRDRIRTGCIKGWNFNFKLYGKKENTSNTITIYNIIKSPPDTSSLNRIFQPSPPNEPPIPPKIHIPGKRLETTKCFNCI